MRRVTAVLSLAAVVLMAAGVVAQTKPSFAGEWKMVIARGQGEPGVDLIITQDATAMTVEYMRGQAPAKLTYMLDGSVSKNMMAGHGGGAPTEQLSKALWAGNNIVVTTTTGAGDEKRTFSMDGGDLVVEISAPARIRAPNVTRMTCLVRQAGGPHCVHRPQPC
jgi:hypothetical protein